MYAQKLLYDTLITINPDGTYAPSLATSWEISPDGLTYTFKIREGVKFTDGEVCDAQAILANFNALNGFKERYKWTFLQVLDHFEAPDNQSSSIDSSAAASGAAPKGNDDSVKTKGALKMNLWKRRRGPKIDKSEIGEYKRRG